MKACNYCGRENLDETQYCVECGTTEFKALVPPKLLTRKPEMNRLGGFLFGVALLIGIPVSVFFGATFVAGALGLVQGESFAALLWRWAIFGLSFISFLLACDWRRKKHRAMSSSGLLAEVIVSVVCGFAFMIVLLLLALYAVGGVH
jgi:hypothetical protein